MRELGSAGPGSMRFAESLKCANWGLRGPGAKMRDSGCDFWDSRSAISGIPGLRFLGFLGCLVAFSGWAFGNVN